MKYFDFRYFFPVDRGSRSKHQLRFSRRNFYNLEKLVVIEFFFASQMQTTCGKYLNTFIRIANAWVHHTEILPLAGYVARFFLQLTPSCVDDRFASVNFPGGQLKKYAAQWVTKLALKQQIAIRKEGQNDYRARMNNIFPYRFLAIG